MIIAIDGIDGAGKSTLIEKLKEKFTSEGKEVVVISNPGGGTDVSALCREIVFTKDTKPSTDMFLLAASFSEIWFKIKEYNDQNKVVIVDRWLFSAEAYQSEYKRIPGIKSYLEMFDSIKKEYDLPLVDLYLWLDIDFETVQKRLEQRKDKNLDKYEGLNKTWYDTLHRVYLRTYGSGRLWDERHRRVSNTSYFTLKNYSVKHVARMVIEENTTPLTMLEDFNDIMECYNRFYVDKEEEV